ncbi:F-box-like domain superfamily [Arabidopsis suecica]|uniref:F-box-like domain superfamily n=1 Tax=Arabidopsis suecica TaxID=45249 RepID=A0A8T2HID1_ARASU|nr:F-box-like domain superfamily [Arabidopsis suecica]
MDEDGERRVRTKRSCSPESSDNGSGDEVDWISDLPEALIVLVLLNLPTKDVIKTSVLSTKWRNIWRYVPRLDLDNRHFTEFDSLATFTDRFMRSNRKVNKFKLRCGSDLDGDVDLATCSWKWIYMAIKRKVQHIDVTWPGVRIYPEIYNCESLVSLKLSEVTLTKPEFVSLPSLKVLVLDWVEFYNEFAFDMLMSGCPVLESFTLCRRYLDNVRVLRVISQSLLSFNYYGSSSKSFRDDLVVILDAPKLEKLKLSHQLTASFIIENLSSLVEADIDIEFNFCRGKKFDPDDLPKREMIRNFLVGLSRVKTMTIAACTLEVIYDYSRCEPLPLFPNLSFFSVEFYQKRWEILPFFFKSCSNLKSLVLESDYFPRKRTSIISEPRCLLSSLEYVKIEFALDKGKMELVRYLLENSPILKKLTLSLDHSSRKKSCVILRELITIPRCSTSCRVIVL